ncbi:hypothetical protein JTE90_026131 [Oedothorax gibbosus]|uniref:Uncharacterized protein n=1 Tax=Oedothorax gibbosus TaxID=931172 RepID=A0AAV6V209_9ARAC|nr:hypothetical protein JTE90_026131 [Oedothorax gibbosus]
MSTHQSFSNQSTPGTTWPEWERIRLILDSLDAPENPPNEQSHAFFENNRRSEIAPRARFYAWKLGPRAELILTITSHLTTFPQNPKSTSLPLPLEITTNLDRIPHKSSSLPKTTHGAEKQTSGFMIFPAVITGKVALEMLRAED